MGSASLTVTLTLSNPAAGALSTATAGAVTSVYNAASGVWSASGGRADINALLAGLVFNPSLNFNGDFSVATSVHYGGAPAVTGSKAFTGIAVNDAPIATNLSAPETYTEDTPLNLTDIVVSDVDSANVTVTLTLSNTAAGALSTATSNAVTSTFAAGVWTASGAKADVNTLLAGVIFTPASDFNDNFTVTTRVSDGVNPALIGSKTFTGIAVDDRPVLADTSLSLTVAMNASGPVGAVGSTLGSFTGGISDPDSGAVKGMAITGTVETDGTWYYTTDGGANWQAVGAVSATSALLLADNAATRLYFAPVAGFSGSVPAGLTFKAWDQTSGAAGDRANTVPITTATSVTPIAIPAAGSSGASNPYPATLNVTGLVGTILDINVSLNGLTHTWPDDLDVLLVGPQGQKVLLMSDVGGDPNLASVNLTFDDAAALSLPDNAQIVSGSYKPTNFGGGDTFTGVAEPFDSLLSVFNGTDPNGDWRLYVVDDLSGDVGTLAGWSLTITTSDLGLLSLASDSIDVTVAANVPPTATHLDTAETYTEDTPLNLTDIVVADANNDPVTVTLTLSNAGAGALSTATSGAVTSTYNPATGVWSASGAIADVNALLAGVTFTPTANFNGNFTVATSVSDGVAPAITGSKAFTGTPVNDAPTATHLGTAETYTEDTPLNLTDIVVADVDSPNVTVTLTLSSTAAGALSTATSGAVTSTYNPTTGVWSASGAIADVNALLAGVTFTPALNFHGNFTIATSVSDGVAPAITGTKAFTGTPVNDAPTGGAAITGTPVQGRVLTADTHTLADVDGLGTLHYQWLRGGVAIAGAADAPTYTTTLADVGARISLRVSYTDGDHTAESVLSPDTATIGAPLAPPPGLPTLIGPNQGIGNDKLVGSNLAEVLLGGAAVDMLVGGGGNDWLDGGADMDTMSGQSGNDTYVVDNEWDQVYEDIDAGTDTVISSVRFVLGPNLENLYLSGVANINGTGNASANLIIGNAGNNTLAGGLGNDTLIGGDGRDVFVFDTAPSATNRDTIQNFIVADDTIQLSRVVFSALAPGALAAGAFVTGAAALDANDRIIYNSATGALLYDADGSGAGAAVQFATLIGVVGTLSAADFVVV